MKEPDSAAKAKAAKILAQLDDAELGVPEDNHSGPGAFTDAIMAERVCAEVLVGHYCWASGLGWLAFDGMRWSGVPDKAVLEAVRAWARARFDEVMEAALRSGDDLKAAIGAVMRTWGTMLSAGKLSSVLRLAAGIVLQEAREFDADLDAINTPSGTVDLATGEIAPHHPSQLATKVTKARFEPDATHPDWEQALEAVPADVRDWLQLRVGQALSGHPPPDDLLVLLTGGGENGKTTVVAGIAAAIGDYYLHVSHRALLASPDAHPTEFMDFRGARLAVMEETPEEGRLSVTRLKRLVGTPQITARHIRQDDVTFDATHSLFLATNYLPVVDETDHGTWRRLACVRFPYRWRKPGEPIIGADDRGGDPGLRDRIRLGGDGQLEAILAWCVEGARRWYAARQVMPAVPSRVQEDTRAWRKASDLILAYSDDRLSFDPSAHVMTTELFAEFNDWLAARNHKKWSDRTFTSRFGDHGEITANRVCKQYVRRGRIPGLSRPDSLYEFTPVPGKYHAWLGVRFRTDKDDPDTAHLDLASAASGAAVNHRNTSYEP